VRHDPGQIDDLREVKQELDTPISYDPFDLCCVAHLRT